ncbi:MAG: MATE family efflux transporter [Lachnospiraceae bacterium]|nr:MATE family efflux transporter [Lachnospiraceae bacterium]
MSNPNPQSAVTAENKMGTMPINKLIINMSLPMIISMLVQALYNVVDSIFVAKLSQDALTAVSLAFPVQNLMIAVSAGTGVGINSFLSKSLGEKKPELASCAAKNGLFLNMVSALAFTLFGLFFARGYFSSQTDIPQVVAYGEDYLFYITVFCFGMFMAITCERLLQSTGNAALSMISQTVGAITNIILDPILIFGLFGFPRLEAAGAAIATIIGQMFSMCISVYLNITRNKELNLSFRGFRPHMPTIRSIYSVGLPSIFMQSIGSILTYGMNQILLSFSSIAVSVYGAYFKLQSFFFMPIFGMNNGLIPIIAYNYGARRKDRITQTLKSGILIAVSILACGMIVFQIFPKFLLSFFSAEESIADMMSIGVPALRTISLSFVSAGFCIIASATFQALGQGVYSLIVSLIRQLAVLLPLAFILSKAIGLNGVWLAYPIAELFAVALSILMLKKLFANKLSNI